MKPETLAYIVIAILIIAAFLTGFTIAKATYAGDCVEYGEDFYNITAITITANEGTPQIEGLNEWYSEQCSFNLVNGTLVCNDMITDTPVVLCTNQQLAPGLYEITITGYITKYSEQKEIHYYHGGGGGGNASSDRDGDGVPDTTEWFECTDWNDPDSDDDLLNDFEERVEGEDGWITDPCNPDTDGDGVIDSEDPCPNDELDECIGHEGTMIATSTPTTVPTEEKVPIETPETTGFSAVTTIAIAMVLLVERMKRS